MTTCEKCKLKTAEYGPDSKALTLSYRAADRPVVTEAFQPASLRCEECLAVELAERCDRLAHREQLRVAYQRELQRRAESGTLICAECRQPLREFLAVNHRALCQSCVYIDLRNEALGKAMASNSSTNARRQAIVSIMQRTREQARRTFEYLWG